MDYVETLNRAYADLRNSELPEELWAAALPVLLEDSLGAVDRASGGDRSSSTAHTRADGWSADLARKLRVTPDGIEEIFDVEDGVVRLIVPPSRLPAQRAPAMKVVSLLIASARQSMGIDDGWTPSAVLREACKEMGVFDSANFAGELTSIDGLAFTGKGSARKVKVTARGFEAAGQEIQRLQA